MLKLTVEIEREDDGRWISEVPELPGTLAYGSSQSAALAAAEALALRVLADRIERGELEVEDLDTVRFERREPVAV